MIFYQLSLAALAIFLQSNLLSSQKEERKSFLNILSNGNIPQAEVQSSHIFPNKSDTFVKDSTETDETSWAVINNQVDMVIPMVLKHLQKLQISHLQLPNIEEKIVLNSLIVPVNAELFLTDGIAYNMAGVSRYGNAYMTYKDKSFIIRYDLLISKLQFEYNFLVKFLAIEVYGKAIGSLENTYVSMELNLSIQNFIFTVNSFRITNFDKIYVQLEQMQVLKELTGAILSPIANIFKQRIATAISNGLQEELQTIMDDFNTNDPLDLKTFTKQLLSGMGVQ